MMTSNPEDGPEECSDTTRAVVVDVVRMPEAKDCGLDLISDVNDGLDGKHAR